MTHPLAKRLADLFGLPTRKPAPVSFRPLTVAALNIGLEAGGRLLPADEVLRAALARMPFAVLQAHGVQQSTTEPTLCLLLTGEVERTVFEFAAYALAEDLGQDCVAFFDFGRGGKLLGPKAAAWGPFDPAQFMLPDGTPLNDKLQA